MKTKVGRPRGDNKDDIDIGVPKYSMQAVNQSKPVVRHFGDMWKVLPEGAMGTTHNQSGGCFLQQCSP